MGPDREQQKRILTIMKQTRRFEEKSAELFASGVIHGTAHLYIGEEAVAAGVCSALEKKDMITSTHRGHGHCIAKGMDLGAMMAEYMGKVTGCLQTAGEARCIWPT